MFRKLEAGAGMDADCVVYQTSFTISALEFQEEDGEIYDLLWIIQRLSETP